MPKRKKSNLLREIKGTVSKEAELEYGIKEFMQGALIGFIIGFLIATQLV